MSAKRILFVVFLIPMLAAGTARADIASKAYADRIVGAVTLGAGSNVTIGVDQKINVADASVTTAGVAKLGEIPFKKNGSVSGSAMIWVE